MEGSVYRFIIDIGSFRGLQDEIKQLNIQQQLDQIEKEFNSWPLYFQILFAMIIKIEDEFKEKTNIILYSNCENRTSIELKCMVDQRFESDNIKVVVGQQSLFYMLGCSSKEKATVRCISNERFFFSQPFLQTIKSIKDEFECKVYSLFQFGDAIKQIIRTNVRTGSKSLTSKSTIVTGSANSKFETQNQSEFIYRTNLNVVKENEVELSEESKSSGKNDQQSIIEEVQETAEEIKQRQLFEKFNTDPTFTKSTRDFVQKLVTHFLAKDIIKLECTSFVNIVHNLYTQHVGKIINKNKYLDIDEETKKEYFLFILDYIKEKQFFEGNIFELWKGNKCRTLEDMNKFSIITVNKEKLIEECSSISDKSLKNLINDNSNSSTNNSYLRINDAIFKILWEQNFCQPTDGKQIQKPKYLSNIQQFINVHAKSKECSENERTLIKSDKKLNLKIYNSLVDKNLISDKNNFVEFNQTEIDNIS